MERDDIGFGKKPVEGYVLNIRICGGIYVVGDDMHAKSAADIDEYAADPACADDADRFAVEIGSHKPRQTEIEISCAQICLMRFPKKR